MEFSEHKTEFILFFYITEGTDIIVDSINDDVWEDEYKRTGDFIDIDESLDWICL